MYLDDVILDEKNLSVNESDVHIDADGGATCR